MGILEEVLGQNARITILETMLKNRGKITYLSGLAEETGLSHSTVSRVIEDLVRIGLVGEEPLGKQTKIFRLNEESELTQLVITFYQDLENLQDK
ncbi:MAG TPA: helix-turn-helix domain-containing protein [Dehalococcoidia bacterium]|nr:helix-turn-helix domain-containing protein [Dehalococcoidia bacterium]